jgi:hypothetical protein
MSNTLAIGTVTSALQQMLNNVANPLPGDPVTDPDLADAWCSARSLDVARGPTDKKNQLNLFLYQVQPNATFRNMNLRDGDSGQQPLALTLSYVLTAYGKGDDDVLAHRMLGRAMLMLHDASTMTREQLRIALPGNDLWEQSERVRIRPTPLGPEEISKLWTGFGQAYRLTVGYEVTVVLIESVVPKISPLPVLSRGKPLPPKNLEPGVHVVSGLDLPYPTLDRFEGQDHRPAARIGEDLTVFGTNLGGTPLTLHFAHRLLATPNSITITTPHDPAQVTVAIPNLSADWPAGIYTVTADVPSDQVRTTNALAIALAPKIAIHKGLSTASMVVLTIDVTPNVRPEQKVALIIGDRQVTLDLPITNPASLTFTVADPPQGNPVYMRLRVDGVDSLLVADYGKSPPTFDPSQGEDLP